MQSKRFRICAAVLAALVFTVIASAFVVRTDESGIYVVKYHTSPVAMQIKLSNAATLSDGHSQRSSVIAAMQAWNAQLGTLQFEPVLSVPGPYATGNGINEIVMDSAVDGEAFPPGGALAVTVGYVRGDEAGETDLIFNTAYTWDSYRGMLRWNEDIQRVAIHELGHALGLDHPDEHGQSVTAIMNSHVSHVDTLRADDIAGGQKLYGAPGVLPANDNFSAAPAITINTPLFTRVNGATLGGTRESGEPNHAASTGAHSIWWKWTAPALCSVVVNTFGSDFDTVLAVYTGASVSTLSEVASNDDEEAPEQNPTPQRRRTSKVTFTAARGVTYYFAVDGWGREEITPTGYTGSVTLDLSFTQLEPAFTRQPEARTITYPFSLTLQAIASGSSDLAYQWQRNGIVVSEGRLETALNIGSVQPADTGIYTVVATASGVSLTSQPAIVGIAISTKHVGAANEVGSDILHPNGNTFDQLLLEGAGAAFTADAALNQITRLSFIDLSNDIVQLEFSGPGTISIALDNVSGPAEPINYHQPGVAYMKGHAGIVVTGATRDTHLSVFSVGRANAVNQSLFRDTVDYDGVADIAYIAILSADGQFGGLRTANASYVNSVGTVGVCAPGVNFTGPVYIGDITASDTATACILLGSAAEVQINGGDLLQPNDRPVQVAGLPRLVFVAGSDSHGRPQAAQSNRARLEVDGVDVTDSIVVNP